MKIQIENGPAFDMTAGDDSLLRGALRAGFDFPYECSVGGCGGCRFDLLDGVMATLWDEAPGLSERDRRRGKRLACQSLPEGDCTVRVRAAGSEPSGLAAPRRIDATLLARRPVTPDLVEFTFAVPTDMRFRPGQYALLYPPGVQGARAYSLSNLPGEHAAPGCAGGEGTALVAGHDGTVDEPGLWRFMIRRVPGGRGSNALFDQAAPGDVVSLDGPYGHAWLRPGERDVVCIAGGSGLGPMLSVARGVLAEPGSRKVLFFLGLRSQAELGAARELEALATDPRLQAWTVLSNPVADVAWTGPTGFVHTTVEQVLAPPLQGYDYYFAGPPLMVEAVQGLLAVRHGVPHRQIRFDRFV